MGLIFIPHPFGNFFDGKVCFRQKFAGFFHAHITDNLLRGFSGILFKDPVYLGGVQTHIIGEMIDRYLVTDVPSDIDHSVIKMIKLDDFRSTVFCSLVLFCQFS